MPSEVTTLCFHTKDAVERDDSSFTFEVPPLKVKGAMKVVLSSCEFPMTQYTIEDDWARFYMNEGIRIEAPEQSKLKFAIRGEDGDQSVEAVLPMRLNPIRSVERRSAGRLVLHCQYEHGLENGVLWRAGLSDVRVVGSVAGDLPLRDLWERGKLDVSSSPTEVHVLDASLPMNACDGASHLHVPTIHSPAFLASLLEDVLARTLGARVLVRYEEDSFHVTLAGLPPSTFFRFFRTPLLASLGISSAAMHADETGRLVVPSEPSKLWDYVQMMPGFYAPCHRPGCIGPPYRFGTELESLLNRFYFPLLSQDSNPSTHNLIFADNKGHILKCTITPGRYTPLTMCDELSLQMTRAVQSVAKETFFYVTYEKDRFTIACERRQRNRMVPCEFGLLFHHPLGVDPFRFGFTAQPLSGSSIYTSHHSCKTINTSLAQSRAQANLVRVSEQVTEKRFRFHSTPPPNLIGVVVSKPKEKHVAVRTFVNQQVFVSGCQPGDVLRLCPCGATQLRAQEGQVVDATETACTLKDEEEYSCVVTDTDEQDPSLLVLRVPNLTGLYVAGSCFYLLHQAEPWNMHFGKEHSLPHTLVGFPARAVQWGGEDGSTVTRNPRMRLPPFEAPHTFDLDHPDYVLITLSTNGSQGVDHMHGQESRNVFCKLSLYPQFREERGLPRDANLNSTASGNRFQIAFFNPDLRSRYHFHGAEFSFSLSFYSHVPGGGE